MTEATPAATRGDHRLGFSIRVFGSPDLPSHDAGAPARDSHLSVNLAYLRDICLYLQSNQIRFYRMHSNVLPAALHTDPEALTRQLDECGAQLVHLRALIQQAGIRLTIHPYSQVTLNALNEEQAERSILSLAAHARLLEALGQGAEGVVVLHVGGIYDSAQRSARRFVERYESLPEWLRARVALEQDDSRYGYVAVSDIHKACGVPLVYDSLHHRVHNPERVPEREALAYSLGTWPAGVRPKVHYANARSEMRQLEGSRRIKLPTWTEHADFVVPFEFCDWLGRANDLPPFDIMLEAKARDIALLQLRRDVARFCPELVERLN